MSDKTGFIKRYVWLIDEGLFYDRQRRGILTDGTLKARATEEFGPDGATKLLASMKLAGINKADLKSVKQTKKGSLFSFVKDVYLEIRDQLPYRHSSTLGSQSFYEIEPNLQVKLIGELDDNRFAAALMEQSELIEKLQERLMDSEHQMKFGAFLELLYDRFKHDTGLKLASEPALISWLPEEPAFKKLDASLLVAGSTTNWDSFVARVDHPETFKAFLWSIFEPTNFGRQALWITGAGSDGKSSVLNSLAAFMGRNHVLSIGRGSYDSDFFFGEAFGKRLALYADCKNLQVLRKERIKSLLGKDTVSINNKYERAFSSQIYARLIVASNFMPQINYNDDSERTRLLLVSVAKFGDEFGDPDFEPNLLAELPAFLLKCKQSYATECPKNTNLKVPAAMAQNIKMLCSASESDLLEQFISERLEFGQSYYVGKLELRSALKDYFAKHWSTGGNDFTDAELQRILTRRGIRVNLKLKAYEGVRLVGSNKILALSVAAN